MFHGFIIIILLLHLLNFNGRFSKFLRESPSRNSQGKLDRAAPLLTPQEGVVYKLKKAFEKEKLK